MNVTVLLDKIPLLGVFLGSLVMTFLATEYGFYTGRRSRQRLAGETDDISPGPFAAAALSLVAFMLAMVYGTVQSRLHDLKQVTQDEANAIGTVYLRADLLPEDDRAQVRELLRDYVTLRIETVQAVGQPVEQAIDKSKELQQALWVRAVTLADQRPTDISGLFVDSVNELIDLHETRITFGTRYRLPGIIWVVLYGLAFLALAMGGYANGYSGSRRSIALAVAIAAAYSVALMMVIGLDRTEKHLSTVTQTVMLGLKESMDSSTGTQP